MPIYVEFMAIHHLHSTRNQMHYKASVIGVVDRGGSVEYNQE